MTFNVVGRHPSGSCASRRVTGCALAAAAAAPLIGLDDPAQEHRSIRFQTLAHSLKAEVVESAERGQVRAREGSVMHVEVFRMGGVRTSILGRPRRLSQNRPAHRHYTLNCEEPDTVLALPGVDRLGADVQIACHVGASCGLSEPFSSCFSELKDQHSAGDLAGPVGAAAQAA
ncbi:hypothetical protein, partial [Nocardiopsis algeriensis]|uniref:hypothetical protein n=1 Tax=Nocardiopsis algeriensis TaxID=1478215 RepID=UPI001C8877DD